MQKKSNHPIEHKITDALQKKTTSFSAKPSEQLLNAVRAKKQTTLQKGLSIQIPLWQAVAAMLLLGFGIHYLFPKTIIQEKTLVKTEIQENYICETDTIVQIQEVKKIVSIEVPVYIQQNPMPAIPRKEELMQSISNTSDMVNAGQNFIKTPSTAIKSNNTTKPSKGRSIEADADLMDFIIESGQYSTLPSKLKNK